jgi:hypothetical protein
MERLKFTFVTSSTFSCLIAEVIWVRFSAGGPAVAEVAALPTVLLSEVEGLVSAVGVFRSFEVVDSDAFALLSVFVSPAVVLLSEGDFVSAVGFFISFEVVAGVVESEALDLPSAFMSPVVFPSGLPSAC